ncbi:MAG: nitroreductase family protein, partial [Candidatus Nitrosopumilus limneticus]|nr:nitroreductase family protein [Candidatus Nitrosopumilus limneticus]
MRDFHPDNDLVSPNGYVPQDTPDDFDPGIPNQLLDFILRAGPTEVVDTDLFAVMQKRRSTRKFSDKPVETVKIDKIIAAADTAPSAGNFQGFEIFYVK